jgi:nucleotide-binding universal stress UspA family protein/quercetin dioxygenase-like cupin family protein
MSAIRTILHPTDLSEVSYQAFETACSWATEHDARLILLHVIPPPEGCILPEPGPNPLQPAESQDSLKQWCFAWPELPDPRLRVEHRVAEGDAPDEILRLARAVPCDLIVMGTHGRAGLGRLLNGSVAEEVLRKAPCPVVIVKNSAEQAPLASEASARPGDVIDVRPLGPALVGAKTKTLARSGGLELSRWVVRPGEERAEQTRGTTVVSSLEGRVTFTALGKTRDLHGGELVYLPAGTSYTIRGAEGASLLVTAFSEGAPRTPDPPPRP